jgi:suppressor for copper-sensitivity B
MANAADTGWLTSPQNDHARIRFQAEKGQDRILGLLTVELQSGWKTYWRSPGEGGVAPQIHWPKEVRIRGTGLSLHALISLVSLPRVITTR